MKRLFELYQYLVPLGLTPLTYFLWCRTLDGAWLPLSVAWLLPIVFGYVVPGVGTNILGVWEIHTRIRVGRFRPHHGFIFGSASSLFAWMVYTAPMTSIYDACIYAFILASTMAYWNMLYDISAVKHGFISVYNQPWADGKGPEAIVLDYAPVYFGMFGFTYGLAIGTGSLLHQAGVTGVWWTIGFFALSIVVSIAAPIIVYVRRSYKKHGHMGCHPVSRHHE